MESDNHMVLLYAVSIQGGSPAIFYTLLRDLLQTKFAVIGYRPCTNDLLGIKIGRNQNQNWALIGRGSKTSR